MDKKEITVAKDEKKDLAEILEKAINNELVEKITIVIKPNK